MASVVAVAASATADFQRATLEILEIEPGFTTLRCYALFDDPADALAAIRGDETTPLVLQTGGPLFNDAAGLEMLDLQDTPLPPSLAGPADSWVTIGGSFEKGLSDTAFTTGFANPPFPGASVITGTGFVEASGAWFDANTETPEAGAAVIFGQFTVPTDSLVEFSLSGLIVWSDAKGTLRTDPFSLPSFNFPDCDGNGVDDELELGLGRVGDFDGDGVIDPCECVGDVDGNQVVDFVDLTALLASFGPCDGCSADFDQNGAVDITDLISLLAAWGPGCG